MELWYTEKQTPNYGITAKIKETLYTATTPFQELAVIDTVEFGRMLVLDGMVQTTIRDEFVYHEMIAHPALTAHPNPKKVAVIGGGDGGVIREVLKHPSVETAVLVEIDEEVIRASQKYLPEIAGALQDPRVEILVTDGIQHIRDTKDEYDVILVDSTEPVGAAVGLFSESFYANIYEALTADGILVAQTESPLFNQQLIQASFAGIQKSFPITRLYVASVFTYPSGLWSFTMGSKKVCPLEIEREDIPALDTKYYNRAVHYGAFQLPNFVKELVVP